MERTSKAKRTGRFLGKKLMATMLSLLLCVALVPAGALASAPEAWADEPDIGNFNPSDIPGLSDFINGLRPGGGTGTTPGSGSNPSQSVEDQIAAVPAKGGFRQCAADAQPLILAGSDGQMSQPVRRCVCRHGHPGQHGGHLYGPARQEKPRGKVEEALGPVEAAYRLRGARQH